jgi:hypothetical protein
MKRPGRVLARTVIAALAALFVVGWIQSSAPSVSLVSAGVDDLDKFAVVDMADAIDRVAGVSAETR